ncbi:MAG TPA: HAD family hydrolase [Treponema sp.]|nr:HAD family hydrolase [Treponema sp.]
MKVYHLPNRVSGLIFDMDGTLYTHHEYAEHQNVVLIRRLAALRGLSYEAMKGQIDEYRRAWAQAHGGENLSLGNTMAALGIPIDESIRWRSELINPEAFLAPDTGLRSTLSAMKDLAGLAVVTNNPIDIARRTLSTLGVLDLFSAIVGLDTFRVSKPHDKSFLKAAEDLQARPENCIAIGDRYDIDIALPLKLGMGGILISGVEDLPQILTLLQKL